MYVCVCVNVGFPKISSSSPSPSSSSSASASSASSPSPPPPSSSSSSSADLLFSNMEHDDQQLYFIGRIFRPTCMAVLCVHICNIYIDTKIAGIQHLHFLLSHHITLDFAAFGHKQLARYVFPRCSKSISRVIPNGKQDMWQSTQHQQLLCLGSKPLGVKHLAILQSL